VMGGPLWSPRYVEGNKTMDVVHIDLHIFDECDLRDLDFSERNLNSAYFNKVDARGAFFIKAQLRDAHFEGANLRNAYFVDADLRNAHFEGADLRGAIFTSADLRGASFYDTLSDDHTTWDNAKFGNLEPESFPERHTDGIEKIDFSEIEHLLYRKESDVLYEDEAEDEYDYEEA
jgi:Pentapeptide repeats (8 copies)